MRESVANPVSMSTKAIARPWVVAGMTSPYPTVVTVWAAHQSDSPNVPKSSGAKILAMAAHPSETATTAPTNQRMPGRTKSA